MHEVTNNKYNLEIDTTTTHTFTLNAIFNI